MPSPGTPRHPAYPSGHSTYSAAASELLSHFFPDQRVELERLADNIGLARMWAGIHYRSDHTAGGRLGKAVARLVISQLEGDPISDFENVPCSNTPPAPDKQAVRQAAYQVRQACLSSPTGREAIDVPTQQAAEQSRSPQQGAR